MLHRCCYAQTFYVDKGLREFILLSIFQVLLFIVISLCTMSIGPARSHFDMCEALRKYTMGQYTHDSAHLEDTAAFYYHAYGQVFDPNAHSAAALSPTHP